MRKTNVKRDSAVFNASGRNLAQKDRMTGDEVAIGARSKKFNSITRSAAAGRLRLFQRHMQISVRLSRQRNPSPDDL